MNESPLLPVFDQTELGRATTRRTRLYGTWQALLPARRYNRRYSSRCKKNYTVDVNSREFDRNAVHSYFSSTKAPAAKRYTATIAAVDAARVADVTVLVDNSYV